MSFRPIPDRRSYLCLAAHALAGQTLLAHALAGETLLAHALAGHPLLAELAASGQRIG